MTSKTPETFEEAVKTQMRDTLMKSAQYSNLTYTKPDLGAWRLQMEAILAAHTTALEAAKREARIDELDRKMTLYVELLTSPDFKAGFSAALDQVDAANIIRKAELSHPKGDKA